MEKYKVSESKQSKKTILISPTEAIEFLGVSRNRMYEDLLKREDFPAFRIGTKYFVNRELLQEWANNQCRR
ncbi:helix-turn-helix domain-containing protein [Clostridium tyrobutyricum]|uniref:helix-turn-helix domain-containing protein n=1 Tax=Clostridium tyrobutyricum TaxID=1519 RepID=UPI001C387154|nr:helix-turn-helix domain-containing protein [Clostridium tyrobutyricum]MBV4420170.1 helix-turn-helix domain-containing protein [Clostridium tyrobutyricum]